MIFIISVLVWLLFDLVTKYWAAGPWFVPYHFIDPWLYFVFQKNRGIAFGISLPFWIQIVGSATLIGILIFFYFRKDPLFPKTHFSSILYGMVVGGALGNFVNRLFSGEVVDFIYLYPFPVFNLADVGITLGLIVFVLYNLKQELRTRN